MHEARRPQGVSTRLQGLPTHRSISCAEDRLRLCAAFQLAQIKSLTPEAWQRIEAVVQGQSGVHTLHHPPLHPGMAKLLGTTA
jgi:hypothetical protein